MKNEQESLFVRYLDELKLSGKDTSHVKKAFTLFGQYLEEFELDPLLLKQRDAQDFQVYLVTQVKEDGGVRRSKATVLNIIGAVAGFYDHLKRNGQVYGNPFSSIDRIKRNRSLPRNVLSESETNALLDFLGNFHLHRTLTQRRQWYRVHAMAELMYACGARIHEVVALEPKDLDLENGLVTLRDEKTNAIRRGFLNSAATEILRLYLEEIRELVLFERCGGNPRLLFASGSTLKSRFNKMLGEACSRLGLKQITSHHFRHALGVHLLRNGVDIRMIQAILGHRSLNSTQVYTQVDKKDLLSVMDKFHPRVWVGKESK